MLSTFHDLCGLIWRKWPADDAV